MPNREDGALCRPIYDATNNVLRLVPVNSEGKTVLEAAYDDANALTTVAHAEEDASMGGYGDTSQPFSTYKLTFS